MLLNIERFIWYLKRIVCVTRNIPLGRGLKYIEEEIIKK